MSDHPDAKRHARLVRFYRQRAQCLVNAQRGPWADTWTIIAQSYDILIQSDERELRSIEGSWVVAPSAGSKIPASRLPAVRL